MCCAADISTRNKPKGTCAKMMLRVLIIKHGRTWEGTCAVPQTY